MDIDIDMQEARTTEADKTADEYSTDEAETRSHSSAEESSDEEIDDKSDESEDDERSVCSSCSSTIAPDSSLFARFALLGDSPYALLASFSILLLAVFIRFYLEGGVQPASSASQKPPTQEELYQALGPIPTSLDTTSIVFTVSDIRELNATHYEFYKINGFIALRGLVEPTLLGQLSDESTELLNELHQQGKISRTRTNGKQFHVVQQSVALRNPPVIQEDEDDQTVPVSAFLNISLFSEVPRVASALMQPDTNDEKKQNLRLMRDIFLTKDEDPYICGWHVDDYGFWPTRSDAMGVNAWIALDDMPLETGGGFALAVGSHLAPWRRQAQWAIGATTMSPLEGYASAKDMFANRTGGGTCNLETTAPWLQRRMEETKVVHELQRGDIIFHDRWLFHRTVPMKKQTEDSKVYRRYSLRYGPGSSVIPPGFGTELSVLYDESNGGRTADEICEKDGPWYPQALPAVSKKELRELKALHDNVFPVAEKKKAARLQEIQPYLKEIARKQHQQNQVTSSAGSSQDDWCMQRVFE